MASTDFLSPNTAFDVEAHEFPKESGGKLTPVVIDRRSLRARFPSRVHEVTGGRHADAMWYGGLFHREQKTGTILLSNFSFAPGFDLLTLGLDTRRSLDGARGVCRGLCMVARPGAPEPASCPYPNQWAVTSQHYQLKVDGLPAASSDPLIEGAPHSP
jgi:hypothetical protein